MSDLMSETSLDTSDLDMLDGLRHVACSVCYPPMDFGQRFVAICGRQVVATGRTDWSTPPNACIDCKRLRFIFIECPRCGA